MKYKAIIGVVGVALALGVGTQALAHHKPSHKTMAVMGQIKTNIPKPIFFTTTGPIYVNKWNGKTKTFWMHFPKKMGTTTGSVYFYWKKMDGTKVPLCLYKFKVTYDASYNGHLKSFMFSKGIKAYSKHDNVKCRFGLGKQKVTFYIKGYRH